MLLAIDIGNSNIAFGVFDREGTLRLRSRISAAAERSTDEYAVLLDGLFRMSGIDVSAFADCILSSVVPALTHKLSGAVQTLLGMTPMTVGKGLRTGFPIRMDAPAEVGADLIANIAAVLKQYGSPAIVLDFGTVTTLCAINEEGAFVGGTILPGVEISLAAMKRTAAQLPQVSLDASDAAIAIGKNTAWSIRSGLLCGGAAAADGMIDRFADEMGIPTERLHLIATGGLCSLVLPHMRHSVIHRADLTLEGLYELYLCNRKHK